MADKTITNTELSQEKGTVKKQSRFFAVIKRMMKSPSAAIGTILFAIILLCAILGDIIAPYDYNQITMEGFQGPSWRHWFGTDPMGRDLLSRMLVGAKWSLLIGIGSEAISLGGGLIVGSIAGYFGQRVDNVIMRICDVIQAIPGMVLNIALASILGFGIGPCILALGLGHVAGSSRMVRANILKIRKSEFIDAAKSINCRTPRVIIRHVIPNIISPMIVSATMGMAGSLMSASSLSYLGLGVQPPTPEWGALLTAGKQYLTNFPYMCLFPGLIIALTVLSLNLMGDGLRDALDPKLKK